MWLINTSTLQLCEFTRSPPPYATFSHATNGNEASFEDLTQAQTGCCRENVDIIARACDQARNAGLEWLWNHTACVDKRSCAAQSEAINSMAQIYRNCESIIIYLEDFDSNLVGDDTILEKMAECHWIKDIWAIPQIIFPRVAYFFSSDWHQIGSKKSLLLQLSSIIGIDEAVLENSDFLEEYSLARRMSWASEMTALREEDFAYALLGLFDVSMPVLYGEGRKAFFKLQEDIMKDTDDFSLLSWDNFDAQEYNGLFAHSPACFRRFRNGLKTPLRINGEVQLHCAGITMQTFLCKRETGLFLPLQSQDALTCFIPLVQWNGSFARRGNQVYWDLPGPMSLESRRVCIRRDVSGHLSRNIGAFGSAVQEDPVHSCEALDETTTARESRSSMMDYNSNDETGSVEPSAEGLSSRCAPSVSVSEITSHDELIAWSAHERSSVEGTLSVLHIEVRPSWMHGTISEVHEVSGDCPNHDSGDNGFHSPCSESADGESKDGSQDCISLNGTPTTDDRFLDVTSIAKELADVTAEEFLSSCQRESRKRRFIPWQSQDRKRPKLMQSSGRFELVQTSDSGDGEMVLVNKARFFACPFYVQNNKHTKCVTRHHLRSVEDVKEHVCWEHRRRMFCPVCKEEFSSGRDRDAHIRLRTCYSNDSTTPEGITDDQEERIEWEEEPMSEESRWFQIWDIVFPHIEPPSSAFYTGEREVSVSAFRQFWMQRGEEIVAAFLEKKNCQSYSIQNEERKLRAIYDLVVENVVDKIFGDLGDMDGTS